MKIRLRHRLPLEDEHGMVADRVLDVLEAHVANDRRGPGWWVMGDAGDRVLVFTHEADPVDEITIPGKRATVTMIDDPPPGRSEETP